MIQKSKYVGNNSGEEEVESNSLNLKDSIPEIDDIINEIDTVLNEVQYMEEERDIDRCSC